MSILAIIGLVWLLVRITRLLIRHWQADIDQRAAAAPVTGTSIPELAHILTDDRYAHALNPDQHARLRPLLLHWLGLRTDLDDVQIGVDVPTLLRQRWFSLGLETRAGVSDPRAAMAFACLRLVIYLRAVVLMGWLEMPLYTQIGELNVRRIRECFNDDWPAFVTACHQGRQQWQASGRSDVFADYLDPELLGGWM